MADVTVIMARMTRPADTTPEAGKKKQLPLYKRHRRRRIYTAAALVVVIAAGAGAYAATQGGASTAEPGFTISTSTGSVADSDSIIATNSSLANTIPAHLHFVPFEAGVTAIAEMRSGSVQSISGVGNPPTTEAIGQGTSITVVMAQSFDADELLVPASVTTASQLTGKTIGVLVGSSEDYELRGWLRINNLTSGVKLVEMDSESAVAAAYVAHAIDAAYVYGGYAQTGQFLVQQGRLSTSPTAVQIAAHIDPTFVKNALNGDC